MSKEINVLALVKGNERYVFLFDDDNRTETLRQIGRYAANPELSFTWYDAAVMSQKIRKTAMKHEGACQGSEEAFRPFDFNSRFSSPMPPGDSLDWFDNEEAA